MDSSLIEAFVKLGVAGVLSAIICFIFFKYIPGRDKTALAERELDREKSREASKQQADACHETHFKMQEMFLAALKSQSQLHAENNSKERHSHANIAQSILGAIELMSEDIKNNTVATKELTASLLKRSK